MNSTVNDTDINFAGFEIIHPLLRVRSIFSLETKESIG